MTEAIITSITIFTVLIWCGVDWIIYAVKEAKR